MKQFYFKTIFTFCLLTTSVSLAQTYNLDTSGSGGCGANTGIDATFICTVDGALAELGNYVDTNATNMGLSSMSVTVYDACNGDFELFINGESIGSNTTSGTGCSCESIASNPNTTTTINVALTPEIIAAYSAGASNTLTVMTSNSELGQQCFYGANVTVTAEILGVEDFEFNTIKIYPNPASKHITLSGLKNRKSFEIYNMLGAKIQEGNIFNNEEIDIQDLNNGIYFLQFDNGSTLKFIKK